MTNDPKVNEYPPEDVLVNSPFHKALLLFNLPSSWSVWQVTLFLLIPLVAVTIVWALTSGQARQGFFAAAILGLFFAADTLLLRMLPAKGISYGPWQSQLAALAVPRTLAALACGLIPLVASPGWALLILAGLQLLGTFALVYGALIEPFRLGVTHLTLETDRLSAGVRPLKILHISDLHVERLTRREEKVLELAKSLQPDMILITGDYLNLSYVHDPRAQADVRRLLAKLNAPHGVYASLGSPPVDDRDVALALFKDLPIRLLVNESMVIDCDMDRKLLLMGLDCSHHLSTDAAALRYLVSGAQDGLPRVLLYHAPDLMPQAAEHGIDLYLCGHTHGGQVRLPIIGALLTSSQLGKRYEMGLYREGRTQMYVSRGIGLEGLSAPRVRFLAPPEITLITLQGALATQE